MANKLKDFFDARLITSIARDLRAAYPALDQQAFVAQCLAGLRSLELMARGWRVAETMHAHLPREFEKAADILVRSLGAEPRRPSPSAFRRCGTWQSSSRSSW
jgi:hypothetical protein